MEQERIDKYLSWCSENKTVIEDFQKELKQIKSNKKVLEMSDLITEMKEAIKWYMDNCKTINEGRSYDETFYNLGANLINQAEEILK